MYLYENVPNSFKFYLCTFLRQLSPFGKPKLSRKFGPNITICMIYVCFCAFVMSMNSDLFLNLSLLSLKSFCFLKFYILYLEIKNNNGQYI